ncbi:MAG: IPT/TIG domain-containing protein [Bacteroidales bacterium]|nr:IPT/TIG domain-containing protein [Bacteroidales bacterium]
MKRLIFAALALLALTACRDKYEARITDLRLVSVDPRTGFPGELVTIFGWNFSPEASENEVCFGGEKAIVLEASSGRLQVVLPNLPVGNYKISVKSPLGYQEGLSFSFLKAPDRIFRVSTIVGQQGQRKCVDGVGTEALTYMPTGISKAPDGTLWFTDRGGNKVRRIAKDMTVQTIVDASAPGAAVWQGCFDGEGNYWFNDKANGTLKRYEPAAGRTVTVATGMKSPMNVVMTSSGDFLVPARDDKAIWKFDGSGNKTKFADVEFGPSFIAIDPKGNVVSATHNGYRIISISPDGSTWKTIVGDGVKGSEASDGIDGDPLTATITSCHGIDFDSHGVMYISDASFHRIRRLVPDADGNYETGVLETVVGGVKGYADGKGLNVKFNEPDGILVYDDATLYVCDAQNCLIRKIEIQ